jgi:hypothetical protein
MGWIERSDGGAASCGNRPTLKAMGYNQRTGKFSRWQTAAILLRPKSVIDTEIAGGFLVEVGGYIWQPGIDSWLIGARPAVTAGSAYPNITAFSAVAANRPPQNS